jgi:hypothetical protein
VCVPACATRDDACEVRGQAVRCARACPRPCTPANPLSFVAAACGGAGSDGARAILSKRPEALHERTCFFVGSTEDVTELQSYGDVQQGAAEYTV